MSDTAYVFQRNAEKIAEARKKLPASVLETLDGGGAMTIHQVMGHSGFLPSPTLKTEMETALRAAGYHEAPARRRYEAHEQMFWAQRPPVQASAQEDDLTRRARQIAAVTGDHSDIEDDAA